MKRHTRRSALPIALSLGVCSAGLASAQATPATPPAKADTLGARQDPRLGTILTAQNGMTLYLFTKDGPGVSNCYDQCAQAWPPLTADSLPKLPVGWPGKLSLVARKDGAQQVAYNGVPLYFWVKDSKAGDTTGQDVGKVWYAVNPGPPVQTATLGELGENLVAANGMTLYLFTKDRPGLSNCHDQCAQAWPPLLTAYQPTTSGSKLGTTKRKDGALQVTYGGAPLYFWVKDAKPGDATGQNVGKVWFVVKP